MSRKLLILAIVLAGGCSTKNYNVADPVVGPPPPRVKDAIALQEAAEKESGTASRGLLQVSYEEKVPLSSTTVVATVNGRPILVGELLEPYGPKLREYEAALSKAVEKGQLDEAGKQANLRKTQEMLIKRDLDKTIEQILMADAVRSRLKREQLDSVNQQLADYFENDVVLGLKKKFGVDSTAELEALLQEQGMSLESMRKVFADQQLASQYLRTKMGEDPKPSRAELLAVYNQQLEKYHRPMQVKWQQLKISFSGANGKQQAQAKMEQALSEMKAGASFDDVVKKYSDGPLKLNGGHWDWTQPQSVANEDLRKHLESLKTGEFSPVISTSGALLLIKITARREEGYQPLDEVQEDIRQQIIGEFRERRAQEIIKEIRENAVVITMFSEDEAGGEDTPVTR